MAGGRRLPDPLALLSARLGLRDSDECLLWDRVDRMVIGFAAEHEGHLNLLLVEQGVSLVQGHGPVAGNTLM